MMAQANEQDGESRLDAIVLQFIEARTRGETPDIDELVEQHPELEQDIRRRIASFGQVDSLFDLVKQADDSDFATMDTGCSLIGQQIDGFRIVEVIGQGGMGIVFKAQDTRLDRWVAIKTIPNHLIEDEATKARFHREAKLLASLNHPNIAAIHDIIELGDGTYYLVLEHVPGETLTRRIANRPLAFDEALSIARQIAEAVAAAYEKGIIHRDLKPSNVKITPEGQIKVLDFGIAKVCDRVSDASAAVVTQEGHLVGTPAYMSPEQARGKQTDHRTDIWSFGCLLYEMLAGRPPFRGETATDTIAHVLEREPDWNELSPDLPPNICVLIRRCLEKNPRQRLQHIGDALMEITETLRLPGAAPPVAPFSTCRASLTAGRRFKWLITAGIAAVILTGAFVAALLRRDSSITRTTPRPVHFPIVLPQSQQMGDVDLWSSKLILSPDGSRIVYIASQDGIHQLFVRELDSPEPRLIPGTEHAHSPFFLPDGNSLVFLTESKIKKVALSSGVVLTICSVGPFSHGGCWSVEENCIYFTANPASGLFKVPVDGDGKPIPVTHPDYGKGQQVHTQPRMLPGGKDLLFTIGTDEGPETRDIALLSLQTNHWQRLGLHGSNAHYVEYSGRGYLVYAGADSILAVPFDMAQRKVIGPEVKVIDDVLTEPSAQFDLSENGTLIYAQEGVDASKNTLVWVDMQGEKTPLSFAPDMYHGPRLSPDGSQLALIKGPPSLDVYVCDLERLRMRKITNNPSLDLWPVWEPGGSQITYSSCRTSNLHVPSLYSMLPDGSHDEPLLEPDPTAARLTGCWSQDREHLAFARISIDVNETASYDIWVFSQKDGRARGFFATTFNEKMPAFHPSGDWMAYTSDESGRYEVYVCRFPSAADKRQISFNRGDEPVWDPSGRTLYYRSGNTMKAVTLEDESRFTFGESRDLFTEWFARNRIVANYDFDSKGQRFIMVKPVGEESLPVQINVILNWFEELQRLVPPD